MLHTLLLFSYKYISNLLMPHQLIWDSWADMATKHLCTELYWATFFIIWIKKIIFNICTNLWGFKIGAPPVADAVVNHPVLFNAILPSKDLTTMQMLMDLQLLGHKSLMTLMFYAVLPQSSGVLDLPLHPPLDSALLQACTKPECHVLQGSRLHQRVTSKLLTV